MDQEVNRISLQDITYELMRRKEEEKGRYYVPNGKCEEFISEFGSNTKKIGAFIAGNGTGKSAMLANICVNICFPEQNKRWFDYPLYQNFTYNKYIRIVSDPTTIKSMTIPELKKWMPAGRYKTEKQGKAFESLFITDTGFRIELMTYEQDLKEFESVSVGVILMDEPPPYAIYLACISRLRMGGVMGLFFTPLTGAAWAIDEFETKSPEELQAESKFIVHATMEDNCKIHGVRGIIEHSEIQFQWDAMPDDLKEARAMGKFQQLLGLVVKEFNPKLHIIPPFDTNVYDYCFVELLDPHPQTPDALMYVAIDRYNRSFVYEEVFRHMTLPDLAATIKKHREGKRIIDSVIDPSAFNEDQHLKYENPNQRYSLAKWLEDRNIIFKPASKARHEGIRLMRQKFHYIERAGIYTKQPEMFITENCPTTKYEITHWKWDERRGAAKYERNPVEKPVDKDDHMMENLGRFCLGNYKFVPMPENYFESKGWDNIQYTDTSAIKIYD